MFCYQCEQTAGGKGCSTYGVCGKAPEVSDLQDLLIYALEGIAWLENGLAVNGAGSEKSPPLFREGLFSTVTNVDFDNERLAKLIMKAHGLKEELKNAYTIKIGTPAEGFPEQVEWVPAPGLQGLQAQAEIAGIMQSEMNEDIRSLKELLKYGLKGLAAYADHAAILGQTDPEVDNFFTKGLKALADRNLTVDELIGLNMECGKVNIRCMELLDTGNTGRFGHPEPTAVSTGAKKGKAILISGHDLLDLEELLIQTQEKNINVYTHSEMLPANAYPGLKKFPHLAGNYGSAWQNQAKEFEAFPGAILMTTNCIQKPKETYNDRIFTTGLVAWPGVTHISDRHPGKVKDFTPVIEAALKAEGFKQDIPGKEITIGFARNAVLSVAGTVIEAVKSGAIRHFFLIGGCDGAKPGRSYYTELAEQVPNDCVILTLACGKYRFNNLDFGDIGGIPRLLDIGQCNDAYSAVQIAVALAGAFECGVNDLPLSIVLSWYEQKAVVILLSLLSLGIKNIRLGPTLPAFVSPNVLSVLVKNFNIMPVGTPAEDLRAILGDKVEPA